MVYTTTKPPTIKLAHQTNFVIAQFDIFQISSPQTERYAARANLNPIVYEGESCREMIPGRQLMWTTEVENFPGFPEGIQGSELIERMKAQALRFGTRVVTDAIEKVDFSRYPFRLKPKYGDWLKTKSVIIATGARANWLGLPNEQRLARNGGGVSACAVCDGALPIFRNKRIVVVGGGDTAMGEAVYMARYASEVVIVNRSDTLRASPIMAQRALSNPKVRVEWNTQVVDVLGDDFITGVILENTITKERRELECGGLFVAIGHTPNTEFLENQVELHPNGLIKTTPGLTQTSVPGVFAAGDIMDAIGYFCQAITAAATGCMAALEAQRFLEARKSSVDAPSNEKQAILQRNNRTVIRHDLRAPEEHQGVQPRRRTVLAYSNARGG